MPAASGAELAKPLFIPEHEVFAAPGEPWGPGRVLGGLWAYDLPKDDRLEGLAALPGGRVMLAERARDASRATLRHLDPAGRSVSTGPLPGYVSRIAVWGFRGKASLLGQDFYRVWVAGPDGKQEWAPSHAMTGYALADLDGDGREDLAGPAPGYQGVVAAFGDDGRALWRREGRDPIAGVAAGPLLPGGAVGVAVFAHRKGESRVAILDGAGAPVLEFSDDSRPESGVVLGADGTGYLLAHVGSRFNAAHDLLRISRIEGGTRAVVAEASLGRTHAIAVLAADLDGDGLKELVLGTDNGWVLVYDRNARLLGERHFFERAPHLAATDLTGDGVPELLVGAVASTSRVLAFGRVQRAAPPAAPQEAP